MSLMLSFGCWPTTMSSTSSMSSVVCSPSSCACGLLSCISMSMSTSTLSTSILPLFLTRCAPALAFSAALVRQCFRFRTSSTPSSSVAHSLASHRSFATRVVTAIRHSSNSALGRVSSLFLRYPRSPPENRVLGRNDSRGTSEGASGQAVQIRGGLNVMVSVSVLVAVVLRL